MTEVESLAERSGKALSSGAAGEAFELARRAVSEREDAASVRALGFAANSLRRWDDAARAWARAVELTPNSAGVWDQLANAYLELKRPEDALRTIERAEAREIDHPGLKTRRLRCLAALGRRDEALAAARDIEDGLESDPNKARTAVQLAAWYRGNKDFETAARLGRYAAENAPDSHEGPTFLARLAGQLGDIGETEVWYKEALRRSPTPRVQSEYFIVMAREATRRRDMKETEAWYRKALDTDYSKSLESEYHVVMAREAVRRFEVEEALDLYERSLELSPDSVDRAFEYFQFFHRYPNKPVEPFLDEMRQRFGATHPQVLTAEAMWHAQRRDYDKAMEVFERATSLYPADARVAHAYASLLLNRVSVGAAVDLWRRVVKADPNSIDTRQRLVSMVANSNLPREEVVKECEALLELDDTNAEAMLQLGQALHRRGDYDKAYDYFVKGSKYHPRVVGFWLNRVIYLMNADRYAAAAETVEQASKVFCYPNGDHAMAMARLYVAAEMPDKAEKFGRKALEYSPRNPTILHFLLRHLLKVGDMAAAKSMVESLRALNPLDIVAATEAARIHAFYSAMDGSGVDLSKGAPEAVMEAIVRGTPEAAAAEANRSAILVTSSLGPGGAERQVTYTVHGLDRIEHPFDSVDVVVETLTSANNRDFFLAELEATGRTVPDVGSDERSEALREAQAAGLVKLDSLLKLEACGPEFSRFASPLYATFLMRKPSVVHLWQDTTAIIGGFAAVLAGVPKIILATRSTRPDSRRRMRPYLQRGYQLLLERPEVSMVNNSAAGAADYEDWLGLEPGTVGVIHNGLDIDRVRKHAQEKSGAEVRAELKIPLDAPVIGGVLRFSEEKRPELCAAISIEACRRNPDLHSIIVGAGQLHSQVREQIDASGFGDRIHTPGAKRPVEPWMKAMDLLMLTSRMEGMPNVLIEAQALGIPVCSARVGGAPEAMIEGETGILFKADADPAEVAQDILALIGDKARCEAMSERARQLVEETFSIEAMSRKTLKFYGC